MGWTTPRDWVAGEIVTASIMNTHIRDQYLYLKGVGQVPTIQSGLTIDNSLGSERLLLPLLSTAECTTVLNAEGEVAHDEQTHRIKVYDGTAVRSVVTTVDVDDTPVNGATTDPISSNWAYDFINTLTTQADIPYATEAGVWARLAKGTAGKFLKMNAGATAPEWGTPTLTSALLSYTRLGDAVSGDVSYAGWGFSPKALIILASTAAGANSIGFGSLNLAEMCLRQALAETTHVISIVTIIFIDDTAGNTQTAVLKTLDADGFTLTWAKSGTGTATLTFAVLAIA